MRKVLLFIPTFNCEAQISRVLIKLKEHADDFAEILIVDNRSTDRTLLCAREAINKLLLPNTTVLLNNENYSLGGSHKIAFGYALKRDFTHVVTLHGDDQASIDDFLPLRSELDTADCLLGARFHSRSILKGYSRFRIVGNLILNKVCSFVCHDDVLDMGSGLNIYSRRFLSDTRFLGFPDDLTFNVFLLFHTYFSGYAIKYFPLTWREEDQVSNAKVFRQMGTILKLCFAVMIDKQLLYKHSPAKDYSYGIFFKA